MSEGISLGVKSKILPAYRALRDFLRDEYLPRARQSVGLSALPLGESWYAFLVRRETGSRLKAAELHSIGLAETEHLRGRLQSLLAEAGFTGTAQAFYEASHREPRTAFKSAEELQNFYDQLKVESASAIPALFEGLPQGDFAIRRLEPFREATSRALTYQSLTEFEFFGNFSFNRVSGEECHRRRIFRRVRHVECAVLRAHQRREFGEQ